MKTTAGWVKMSQCTPWDVLAEGYQGLSTTQGRPSKDARMVIGAVIIKHKLCLSDEESVAQIQENPSASPGGLSKGGAVCSLVVCRDPHADEAQCV